MDWIRGGDATASGEHVTPEAAAGLPAVYDAIRILSETVAQLPLNLYRTSNGRREIQVDNPLHQLVHVAPHPDFTSFTWRELMQTMVVGWGNGYANIERNGRQEPRALDPLLAAETRVIRENGRLVYINNRSGREVRMDPANVLHIPALSFDGIMGRSPIRVARESLGVGMASQKFGGQFFGNGAHMGTIVKHPKALGNEGRNNLKAAWDKFRGAGYQGAIVVEEGMDVSRLAIPPNEAQFIETRKFSVTDVARIFNIPPHMLGDLEKATFSNISEQSIQFLRFTMTPWLIKWEHELNRKLLTDAQRRAGFYFKFVVQGLMRGTQKERYDSYHLAIVDGWMNRNEVRELEDMNPEDGLSEFLVPMNMGSGDPSAQDEEAPQEAPGEPEDDEGERFAPFVRRIAESLALFDEKWLLKRVKRHGNEPIQSWINDYGEDVRELVERHASPLAEASGNDRLVEKLYYRLSDLRYSRARVDRVEDIGLISAEEVQSLIEELL